MKLLDEDLADHLAGGVTTLCWCWRLTRRDDVSLGFTDHDRDLIFEGTTFEAAAGFTASEIRDAVGLAVDNLEVESALSSNRLDEGDILAGLYDDADVEIFRVNWQAPAQRVLIRSGSLGEVRRNGLSFTAEVRGLSHYLQQPKGRLYQFGCDADLGDARCTVAIDQPEFRAASVVSTLATARTVVAEGLEAYAPDWFTRGLLRFTSGANSAIAFEVKRHSVAGELTSFELWQEPVHAVQVGDAFIVTAGCDKQPGTCGAKFSNIANFRGFPHMPGNDFVSAVARSGRVSRGS